LCNVDVTLAEEADKEIKTIISILQKDAQVNKNEQTANTSNSATTLSSQTFSSIITNNEFHKSTAKVPTFFLSTISPALSSSSSSSFAAFSACASETEAKQSVFATSTSISSGVQTNSSTSTTSGIATVNRGDINKMKTAKTTSKEKTVLCRFFPLGTCKKGTNCTDAHGENDLAVNHH
jgi:hypothetical protein